MAINGKIIKGFANKAKLENTDAFLFQRNNEYFYVNADALGSGTVVSDTRANVNTAKSASNLSVGALYYLSDKYIWVNALDVDKVDLNALFLARNADYQSAGVYSGITVANGFTVTATGTNLGLWTDALAPASGDVVIWNNLHWLNITGANGASNPTVDTTNWESVSNTDIDTAFTYGYIQEIDFIEYVFDTDTIIKRIDSRGNLVNDSLGYGAISGFVWGDDAVKGNIVESGVFTILNKLYSAVQGNVVNGFGSINTNNASSRFNNNVITTGGLSPWDFYMYNNTDILNSIFLGVEGASGSKTYTDGANDINSTTIIGGVHSTYEFTLQLVTTAYSGATTYSFGDFATSGTVTYMYINATDTAGNAPPNATYWVSVFDWTTAGRYKLTIPKQFSTCANFRLESTNATETIDEIIYLDNGTNAVKMDFSLYPASGLTATVANTAHASLANAGEYLSNANSVIDGSLDEWVTFQNFQVNGAGTTYVRRVFGNTNYA